MGVKGLWTLLGPYCDRKPLFELRGETVAVDLSGWVCDSQNVTEYHAQPRLYLRNLYFRTCYLLLAGVTPVFVLEGEAPAAKQGTMAARNQLQFRGTKPRPDNASRAPDTRRRRFGAVLTQCENLLRSMGLQCVKGCGEAEAMCAHLNATGTVSAIISQDSDCFVYGGLRVYRNFSVSNAGCNSANSGSVDIYDLTRIQQSIDIGRHKMVALALLCGSDYNGTGVDGVGYSTAVSFLSQHSDNTIIDRLVSWTSNPEKFEELSRSVEDPTRCVSCGHTGSTRLHTRQGCTGCGTRAGCDQAYKEKRQHIKAELAIRSKALKGCNMFPDSQLLKEFLQDKEIVPPDFDPRWRHPDLIKFTKLMMKWLDWPESYCLVKFLPLLTRWQLLRVGGEAGDVSLCGATQQHLYLRPACIKKKRNPKGVACYEVVWEDPSGLYDGLVSDDQYEGEEGLLDLWTTVERQDLMEAAFPDVVETFKLSKKKPLKEKKVKNAKKIITSDAPDTLSISKTKKKQKKKIIDDEVLYPDIDMADLNSSLRNLSINSRKSTKSSKHTVKRKATAGVVGLKTAARKYKKKENTKDPTQRSLNSFVRRKSTRNQSRAKPSPGTPPCLKSSGDIPLVNMMKCMSPLLLKKTHLFTHLDTTADLLNNLSCSSLEDELSDADASGIVKNILRRDMGVHRDVPWDVSSPPMKEIQNFSTPVKSSGNHKQLSKIFNGAQLKRRVSYFFNLDQENDAFERSLDLKNMPDEDCELTEELDPDRTLDYYTREDAQTDPGTQKNLSSAADEYVQPLEDKLASLERRLFGGSEREDASIVSVKSFCLSPSSCNVDCSAVYTPLADRIKKMNQLIP